MLVAQTVLRIGEEAANQSLPFADQLKSADAGFGSFISGILSGVLVIAAILVLLYLIWGGIEWITSGGDKAKAEKARNRITQAIIGIIVLAASTAIMSVVQGFLGVQLINFSGVGGGGGGGGTGAGSGASSKSSCSAATAGRRLNDGGAGGYCTSGAAIVQCSGPDSHLPYYHFDPCDCANGAAAQQAGYDFSSC